VTVRPLSAGEPAAGQTAAAEPGTRLPAAIQIAPDTDPAARVEVLTRPAPAWRRLPGRQLPAILGPVGWPVVAYCVSRLFLLALAGLVAVAGQHPVGPEFFGFDGQWYLRLAQHGYPDQPLRVPSTLGFFPLYPVALRAVSAAFFMSVPRAALVTSMLGGLAAAVLVQRLATAWWGQRAGYRATLVFCLFPGTIVFSMAYSECLTIPLALGCLLALRSRRWLLAGLLAALATAVEPIALVLGVACLAVAIGEVRRRGWRDPEALRSLAAPLLAPLGIGGFAVFLWAWTGTPFAAYLAQHYGWHQQTEPLALLALPIAKHLLSHPAELILRIFSWNIWNGVLGGVFLVFSIRALRRVRAELSPGTLVLTVGIAAVSLWSVLTPPNARIVLMAFPAVLVWGHRLSGRRFWLFLVAETLVLVLASVLTFGNHMLP
jgi:hypothetical protein